MSKTAILFLLSFTLMASGQKSFADTNLYYWFDQEETIYSFDFNIDTQFIDCSFLPSGIHTIHFQMLDSIGIETPAQSEFFFLSNNNSGQNEISQVKWWFDNQPREISYMDTQTGTILLDCSNLCSGIHTVHFQAYDSEGEGYPVQSAFFFLYNDDVELNVASEINWWFDDQTDFIHTQDASGGSFLFDCTTLCSGVHSIYFQLLNPSGEILDSRSDHFLYLDTQKGEAKRVDWWFDGNDVEKKSLDGINGIYELDCSSLPAGIHTVSFQIADTQDNYSSPQTDHFLIVKDETADHLIYWFDNGPDRYSIPLDANTIDVSDLSNGYHDIKFGIYNKNDEMLSAEISQGVFVIVCLDGEHHFENGSCTVCGAVDTGIDYLTNDANQRNHYYDLQGRPITSPNSQIFFIERKEGASIRIVKGSANGNN